MSLRPVDRPSSCPGPGPGPGPGPLPVTSLIYHLKIEIHASEKTSM